LGPEAVIETSSDLLSSLYCPHCDEDEPHLASLGKVHERQGRCPACHGHRTPNLYHTIDGREAFLDRTLGELGIPLWDVLGGRCRERQAFYEFAADRAAVLGTIGGSFNPDGAPAQWVAATVVPAAIVATTVAAGSGLSDLSGPKPETE
jgi:hypothetical protein